ncbi:hypothetical protein B0T18DRAFT_207686 [Schizothecium vesticola]|uniref:Uncharacterized protein n=1 Tax=Schizothecium vesticola TaxID=314040 RepID=A0AA40EJA0_9PEZI|nr:hypothetical protein B0T18DRAFT_207686 [Schizothecium vesticola]
MLRKRRKHLIPFAFMDNLCRPPQLLFPKLYTSSASTLINSFILLASPSCPPLPNPRLRRRSSKLALLSKLSLSNLTKSSLDYLSNLFTMPPYCIQATCKANFSDFPWLKEIGMNPTWRAAPVFQAFGISPPILEWILDARSEKFIVLIQMQKPMFARPGTKKSRCAAVALLEKPDNGAPIATHLSPYAVATTGFTNLAKSTAEEVNRPKEGEEPTKEAKEPKRYMHLHLLAVDSMFASPGDYVDGVNAMLNKAWELASSEGWGLSMAAAMDVREGPKLFELHGFKSHCMWQDPNSNKEFMMMSRDPPAPMSLGDRLKAKVEKWKKRRLGKSSKSKGMYKMGPAEPLWTML